eukprot:CAMPEP_0194218018 /NCGR_PEP_ID=MMETSP0156-20130528/22797_1 /TAXON_ID=33649 /ORGANISM="Thalassionema nitzschioides, Strain L26-B" /LENGTH=412 /DNA_ID=CAMNT_0038947237 /DNA_START=33 /DNA_END=1271 /DNA_ORIENTATION=+
MQLLQLFLLQLLLGLSHGFFTPLKTTTTTTTPPTRLFVSSSSTTTNSNNLETAVSNLKQVLEREYVTFFDPMVKEYYLPQVKFTDPLNKLEGIDAYANNVDMLAGRTWMGKILFDNASIQLHSVTGGEILDSGSNKQRSTSSISNIQTRWTLRFTFAALPWKPTARFSGISVYEVQPSGSPQGVVITSQHDYWDNLNLQPGGTNKYEDASRLEGLQDLWNQLKPGGFQAQAAAPELPYSLLRRGKDYQVRRYPSYTAVRLNAYTRRDEGYERLGSFTSSGSESALGPALLRVQSEDSSQKTMSWPLTYAPPGETEPPSPKQALQKLEGIETGGVLEIVTIPSQVIAVRDYTDASMEPVVRKNDRLLRESLQRDGLVPSAEGELQFAQYDAIFSMGQRRGEVWIPLQDGGHPW